MEIEIRVIIVAVSSFREDLIVFHAEMSIAVAKLRAKKLLVFGHET